MPYTRKDVATLADEIEARVPGAVAVFSPDGHSLAVRIGDRTTPAAHPAVQERKEHPSSSEVPELFRTVEEVKAAFGIA